MKSLSYLLLPVLSLCVMPLANGQVVMRMQTQDGGTVQDVQSQAIIVTGESGENGVMEFSTVVSDGASLALPMLGGSLGSDMSSLMLDPQVRNELELVDDQVQQLKDIQAEFGKRLKDNLKFDAGNPDPERMKNISNIIKEMNAERMEKVHSVLMPHQSKRLKQISRQMSMKNKGDVNALTGDEVAEELGIDDDQKKRLKERSKEIQKELQAEIAKLKKKAREDLMKELRPEQRKQMEEMLGDEFEYKKRDWRKEMQERRSRRNSDDR